MDFHKAKITIGDLFTMIILLYFLLPIALQYIRFVGILIALLVWFAYVGFSINQTCEKILLGVLGWIVVFFFCRWLLGASIVNILYDVLSVFLFFFPALLFYCVKTNKFSLTSKSLLIISNVALLIGAINTIIVLNTYPFAARILATGTEKGEIYAKMGAGGYGFVYGVAFLIPCIVRGSMQQKGWKKFTLLIYLIVMLLLLIKAAYTIAIFVASFGIVFAFCNKTWKKVLLVVMGVICILFVDDKMVGNLFATISNLFPNENLLHSKFNDVAELFYSNDIVTGTGGRSILYEQSWNAIKASPILGALYSGISGGGHTSWLDLYANYGVISLLFISLLLFVQKSILKSLPKDGQPFYVFLCVAFWLLGFINPVHTQMEIGMVIFFIAPIWIELDAEKRKFNYSEDLNSIERKTVLQ